MLTFVVIIMEMDLNSLSPNMETFCQFYSKFSLKGALFTRSGNILTVKYFLMQHKYLEKI